MATIKSYTDISQSKKLTEILPLESADMAYYQWKDDGHLMSPVPFVLDGMEEKEDGVFEYIPCWSLAALLSVLPNGIAMNKDSQNGRYHFSSKYIGTYVTANNPIDACYEMIIKLHEKGLL